jgi:HK97 family phage major capsid protein
MLEIGRGYNKLEMAHDFIRAGKPLEEFQTALLRSMQGDGKPFRPVMEFDPLSLGRDGHEKFSVLRAIRAMVTRDFRDAGYEREVSDSLKHSAGRDTEGMFIPLGAIMPRHRSMNIGNPLQGGSLVAEQRLEDEFIDVLRPVSITVAAGARLLPGLQGNVSIAKRTTSIGGFWVGEDDNVTESNFGTGELSLIPHTCGGLVKVTRKLMLQTGGAAEQLTRGDIAEVLGTEIDKVAIAGSGQNGQPMGILNTSGIGSVSVGNTVPDWEKITSFIGSLGAVNSMTGRLAWATTPQVHARLLAEAKDPGSGQFVWEPAPQGSFAQGSMAGYPAFTSTNVPSNLGVGANRHALVFGNWADLLIGTWSAIELMIDPYTNFKSGSIWVRGLVDIDLGLRHVQAMTAAQDIDPTVP